MTPNEIDNLAGADLDAAISDAAEPMPNVNPYDCKPFSWWVWDYVLWTNMYQWIPKRKLAVDGGNIAVDLLDRLREWGWLCELLQLQSGGWYVKSTRFAEDRILHHHATGESLPLACARLFLRVHDTRQLAEKLRHEIIIKAPAAPEPMKGE